MVTVVEATCMKAKTKDEKKSEKDSRWNSIVRFWPLSQLFFCNCLPRLLHTFLVIILCAWCLKNILYAMHIYPHKVSALYPFSLFSFRLFLSANLMCLLISRQTRTLVSIRWGRKEVHHFQL